jgi:hypothetical protein
MISQNNCHQTAASKSAQRCALIGGAAGAITICIGNGAALVITTKACYAFRNSCGSFAMLAAIRRASVAREQCFFLEIDVRQARAITPSLAYYSLSSPRTLPMVGFRTDHF